MAKDEVVDRVTALAESLLSSQGMELVDIEYKREGRHMVLRLFVDKAGGITLDDCALVSRDLSEILDVEDFISENYTLEVSSPGLNRPLKRESDYERYRGRLVKVRTYDVVEDEAGNRRKTFLGDLEGLAGGVVTLKLREGQMARIPLAKIAKANLEFEF
ncbi:ribosome maturation factor RimP [Geobacter hydrogenophilus]|uniref:Ribosome maturation factor RimP n=1 Tax=Geobacter hydrogenophilus TaxID=40983 RepID=A0A9W6G1S1_9BACT|nr:ribosome maturation factor RimP [Geobacter hydrogenophilus]MBT0893322.1 ribosome maturation factor RimP [Geobacter hydrogenophilus]GLI38829.1 ribosome maturation factor RimP [Geobacter hydrogenophilus]